MRRHRCHTKPLDPHNGSVIGYVSKYIAKNIDGYGVDHDLEASIDGDDGSQRAERWATCYGIRQFQQIGRPPVQLYREFRRIRTPIASPSLEKARLAADAGDWAEFIQALGGIESCRNTSMTLWKEQTGELTRYGDLRPPQTVGILNQHECIRTRSSTWRIRWGPRSGHSGSPWTRVRYLI